MRNKLKYMVSILWMYMALAMLLLLVFDGYVVDICVVVTNGYITLWNNLVGEKYGPLAGLIFLVVFFISAYLYETSDKVNEIKETI